MTTETVCVPRELLEWVKEQLPNHVALDGETDLYRRAQLSRLLAQSVASEPVGWELEVEGYKSVLFDNYQRALSEQEYFQGRGRTSVVHTLYRLRHPPAPAIPEGYALV